LRFQGLIWVNDRPLADYFPRLQHRVAVLSPFQATRTAGLYDAFLLCQGGGLTGTDDVVPLCHVVHPENPLNFILSSTLPLGAGQAEAARMGLSRALQNHDPFLRSVLRDGVS
jgi:ribosomal protein S9